MYRSVLGVEIGPMNPRGRVVSWRRVDLIEVALDDELFHSGRSFGRDRGLHEFLARLQTFHGRHQPDGRCDHDEPKV